MTAPHTLHAQPKAMPVVGFLSPVSMRRSLNSR
jgi:hypothetical protein